LKLQSPFYSFHSVKSTSRNEKKQGYCFVKCSGLISKRICDFSKMISCLKWEILISQFSFLFQISYSNSESRLFYFPEMKKLFELKHPHSPKNSSNFNLKFISIGEKVFYLHFRFHFRRAFGRNLKFFCPGFFFNTSEGATKKEVE